MCVAAGEQGGALSLKSVDACLQVAVAVLEVPELPPQLLDVVLGPVALGHGLCNLRTGRERG